MASATIQHVAELAGVSTKTVSRVLNDESGVAAETRRRVTEAAERLQYRPNAFARSLAGARSHLIALFFDNPSDAYLGDIQRGAAEACRRSGYHLVVEPLELAAAEAVERIRATVAALRVEGVILPCPLADQKPILDALDAAAVPYVRVAPTRDLGRAAHVRMDDRRAAYEMTAHLLALGHEDIAFVCGHPDHGVSQLRLDGFVAAMRDHRCPVRPERIAHGLFTFRSGYEAAERLLLDRDRPTAIFASNDDMALGVLAAAGRMGLLIPDQLSVAGFDDVPAASAIYPQLTTVRQPILDMGRVAAETLIEAARDGRAYDALGQVLPFQVMARGSSAPPRRPRRPRPQPSLAASA